MKRFRTTALTAGALAAILGCQQRQQHIDSSSALPLTAGIDVKGMEPSVAPGDDFDAYANGGWAKATEIPPDKGSYGMFAIVADTTRAQMRALIQDAPNAKAGAGPEMKKIGDFYSSFMDEAAIEAQGIAPVKPKMDAIAAIANRKDLARAIGARLRADVDPLNATNFETTNLMGVWVAQGLSDPSRNYPYLLQGGLGMPDREYYTSPKPRMADLRKQYQAHVAAMLKLAGFSDAEARAGRAFALEMKIAGVHATRVESNDVQKPVQWKRAEFAAKAPGLDWTALLEAASLQDAPAFYIWHPKAIPGLAALAAKEPLDAWKDWLSFHEIANAAQFLPKAFVEELFAFRGKALSGIPALRPRWQRGVDFTSISLGEAVGKAYVTRHFPPESKARVQAMVADLVKAFTRRVDGLTWMSAETKAKAKQKLEILRVGVGYPDQWADYTSLEIAAGDPLGNAERAHLFDYRRQLAKLKQPVDRGEWWMTPQTVNAVNLPLQNALNFPAAFLQPPYFDPKADAAYNYGALGAVIGHEICHSFDDMGSQFDAEGRLFNWWTKADFEHFSQAGAALVAQYDGYRPFPDIAVNGKQTLGENIADAAGLLAAYDAYRLSLGGKPDAEKEGFTGDQRFFISYAQAWRTKTREAQLRRQVATDGHAPAMYRVATVRNLDAWYEAFAVKPGTKLYLAPEARVRMW